MSIKIIDLFHWQFHFRIYIIHFSCFNIAKQISVKEQNLSHLSVIMVVSYYLPRLNRYFAGRIIAADTAMHLRYQWSSSSSLSRPYQEPGEGHEDLRLPKIKFEGHHVCIITCVVWDNILSNFSIIGNIPPKDVCFSDFICNFVMPDEVLFDCFCNTKLSESSDMAKSWAAWLVQVTGSAERLRIL